MTPLYAVFAGIIGLIIGSFLSMLIPRLHDEEKGIFFGRSHCPHCKKQLRAQDLIPLLSYLFLRGRCQKCKTRISFWYPLIELFSGLSFALLYVQVQDPLLWAWLAPHAFVLLFIFFYDLRYKEIHDAVMIPGILFALLASFFIGDPVSSLIGSFIAISFFALQYLISRGTWIGIGDLRIGAFMGLFLGWEMTLLALLASYLIGSAISIFLLVTKKATPQTAVPLGPFLVLGTLLAFFWGDSLLEIYWQFL